MMCVQNVNDKYSNNIMGDFNTKARVITEQIFSLDGYLVSCTVIDQFYACFHWQMCTHGSFQNTMLTKNKVVDF